MSAQLIALKLICGLFILATIVAAGYFNMVYTWGMEVKSFASFFGFWLLGSFLTALMQEVLAIKVTK
jgi:hypothetical protein